MNENIEKSTIRIQINVFINNVKKIIIIFTICAHYIGYKI